MSTFTRISPDAFNELQLDAGVLLKSFDPSSPSVTDANIICATTGGISISCVPTYSDMGEDIDNCPANTKELKHLDSWDCKVGFTALGTSLDMLKLSLGCATVTSGSYKVAPNAAVAAADFSDLWWVGDRADGGFVAVKLLNALSTSGLSLKSSKDGKGQLTVELTGHISINTPTSIPMEFYSKAATTAPTSNNTEE